MSSRGLPEVLMVKVDEYVDSLAPQIQPRVAKELELFQQRTIDSLETQVIDAFRALFDRDRPSGSGPGDARSLDRAPPDAYGGQSLPFADEIASLTRSFGDITSGAGDDLRDIFNLTEGRDAGNSSRGEGTRSRGGRDDNGEPFSGGARGFLSAALNAVQDHLEDNNSTSGGGGGQRFELDGLLGIISNTVKDAAQHPEEKARLIAPEIREKVGAKLRDQHVSIAERFTKIALDHIKRWLRGNTSTRDIGDGVKGEFEDQVRDIVKGLGGLFGSSKQSSGSGEHSSRGIDDRDRDGQQDDGGSGSGSGFSRVISNKLSTGLAKVHREVRLEFRKVLGEIEKRLFELLPDEFQRPLEKILGGNPFDSELDSNALGGSSEREVRDRGFADDIKAKLVDKIRGLVRKVQETLRESILGVVNGGHRKFERESWRFVQNMVEEKVQKYLPSVKITVPDDIGDEGVSVGAPTSGVQLGGGAGQHGHQGASIPPPTSQPASQPPGGYASHEQHYGGQPQHGQGHYAPPSNYQGQQDYRPEHHTAPPQQYRPQEYQPDRPQEYQHNQGYRQDGGYRPSQGYQQSEDQGYRPSHGYQQDQPYRTDQSYGQDPRHDQDEPYGSNPRY
ncbi:hypothetical protein S40293_00050 [Stachybotrys chartarum IBT 40293]|nr:hypothetical protein S40293_00050 [Stachybotrys chartarum IBT 40293]